MTTIGPILSKDDADSNENGKKNRLAKQQLVRLSEAKRRVEAKYIFKVIQFNC